MNKVTEAILALLLGMATGILLLMLTHPHDKVGLINTRSTAMESANTPEEPATPQQVSEPAVTNSPSAPQTDAATGEANLAQDEPQPVPTPVATPIPEPSPAFPTGDNITTHGTQANTGQVGW